MVSPLLATVGPCRLYQGLPCRPWTYCWSSSCSLTTDPPKLVCPVWRESHCATLPFAGAPWQMTYPIGGLAQATTRPRAVSSTANPPAGFPPDARSLKFGFEKRGTGAHGGQATAGAWERGARGRGQASRTMKNPRRRSDLQERREARVPSTTTYPCSAQSVSQLRWRWGACA